MAVQASPPPRVGPDRASKPVIEARGLTKRYGTRAAVDQLSFEVRPGEVYGLLGPNGAGKTTTVLMLLGLTEPSGGEARVLGVDPMRDPLEVKRHVGYMPDSVGFYDNMSGRANLAYTGRLNRIPGDVARQRIDELLEQVGLADVADQAVDTYSRGMRQRLGIADALLKDPSVLILDEPTASLDPEGVAEVLALIERIASERRIAVLLSSHLLDQVQAICHRVGIFYRGRLIAEGAVRDLAGKGSRTEDVVEVGAETAQGRPAASDVLEAALRSVPGVAAVVPDPEAPGRHLVTGTPGIAGALANAISGASLRAVHLRTREERLDSIYRRLVHAAADRPAAAGRRAGAGPAPRPTSGRGAPVASDDDVFPTEPTPGARPAGEPAPRLRIRRAPGRGGRPDAGRRGKGPTSGGSR